MCLRHPDNKLSGPPEMIIVGVGNYLKTLEPSEKKLCVDPLPAVEEVVVEGAVSDGYTFGCHAPRLRKHREKEPRLSHRVNTCS